MTEHLVSLHGARHRSDAIAEIGQRGLQSALRNGSLMQIWPGVIIPRARALELPTRAAAALLHVGAGGVLSGRIAASLYGCTAAECADVEVTVPYSRWVRRRPGLVIRHGCVADDDVMDLLGMPVQAFDLATTEVMCLAPKRVAVACADQALALVGPARVEAFRTAVLERLVRRESRRGTLRASVLFGLATGRAESPPESWLRLVVAEAGYPLPEPQYEVCDLEGQLVYRLDLAWPDLRIALEYDGYEAHEGRESQDAVREERLRGRGWIVIRVRAEDMRDSRRLLGELAKAFASRRFAA